ncbi:MAG: glycoside hydrolase domain-containing protein [Gemmatimonadota bacterium]
MTHRNTLAIGLAFLAGCGVSLPEPAAAPGAAAFAGFDTWRYPGDEVMESWDRASPYEWMGFYLPAPCHRDTSFSGKRELLDGSGWGLAVLYVGQQTFDGEAPAEITESTVCSSLLLTPERGAIDGRDAVARTAAEGFPEGTVVFLDIERMERITPEMIDYYQAWIQEVIDDGRYRPGTYAHLSNAAGLYNVAQQLLEREQISESVPFWVAGGTGFSLQAAPAALGYPFVRVWQGVLDVSRTWGEHTLQIDENVAATRSPSAPD